MAYTPGMSAKPRAARAEHRWPVLLALVVALTLYGTLPSGFFPPLRYIVVGLGVLLLIPLIAINPVRLHRETTWSKWMSRSLSFLLLAANQVAQAHLLVRLVSESTSNPIELLASAAQVWITNAIVFALVFWELDRGGPVTRAHAERAELPMADFRFPQDEDHDAIAEVSARSSAKLGWTPSFIDYLYFSFSNSMAFSPTDAMPLSHRAKLLMALESVSGFVILALVIARAVSMFG